MSTQPAENTEQTKETENKVAVVVPQGAQALTDVFGDMEDQAGAGLEHMVPSRDMLIPRLTILQALSPQLDKRKIGQHIQGAEVGDLCDVASGDIFEKPLRIVLAAYHVVYLEWAPRSTNQGLKAIHKVAPADTKIDEATGKSVRPNGNLIVMSAQYYGILPDHGCRQVFLPMSSTQFKRAKKWNTVINGQKFTGKDGQLKQSPIWIRSYDLSTVPEQNNQGTWESWNIAAGPLTVELPNAYEVASAVKHLRDAVNEGIVKVDQGGNDEEAF